MLSALRGHLADTDADARGSTGVLLAAALTFTSRKVIHTLADLAAELDRRDGAAPPVAR
jgi:hypothetical protein